MKTRISRILAALLLFAMLLCTVSCSLASNNGADGSQSLSGDVTPQQSEIKNVILIIGDGMGPEHIAAGQLYTGKTFAFTGWQSTGVNTDSVGTIGKGPVLTDSAAAGTAMATGKLTANSYVGKDHLGKDVTTIMDLASQLGKSTGVVTTDTLFGATPAAFSAHTDNRNNSVEIVTSQLTSGVDLLCGSKDTLCTSRQSEIEAAGYTYCDDFKTVDGTMSADKTYWQFGMAGTTASVKLCDAGVKALNYLDQDEDGFVLMIEQAHVDKYSHSNDFGGMVESVKSLNDTVEAVMSWLGDRTDTVVLITADHETGGLAIGAHDRYTKSYEGGAETIYYNWSSTTHTNSKVMLFVYGVTVDFSTFNYYASRHLIKNTNVFDLMSGVLAPPAED